MAYYCFANSNLSLLFGDWYLRADYLVQIFVILSNSEETVLGFALCHPRVHEMSLLTFSKTSICVLPVMKIHKYL